jgi:hypothetical protein
MDRINNDTTSPSCVHFIHFMDRIHNDNTSLSCVHPIHFVDRIYNDITSLSCVHFIHFMDRIHNDTTSLSCVHFIHFMDRIYKYLIFCVDVEDNRKRIMDMLLQKYCIHYYERTARHSKYFSLFFTKWNVIVIVQKKASQRDSAEVV